MSNLTLRILSAAVLVPLVLVLVFFSSPTVFSIAIAAVAGLAGFEFGSFALSTDYKRLSPVLGFLSAACTASLGFFPLHPALVLYFFPAAVLLLFFSFMFLGFPAKESVHALSVSFFGVFYVGILTAFIALIPTAYSSLESGRYAVLMLLLGTFLGDTGAYTFGRLFGKHKLAPKLSPKKTWEGALGGFLSTLASVLLVRAFLLPGFSLVQAVLLSISLSFFCQTGDLAESFVKRGMGVKDSGNLIPGHGGLLDRIDALLFGAPTVYIFSLFY